MPDWSSAVRQHLRGRKIAPVREAEIIAELTEHLEAAWADELAAGVPETEAYRQVLARFDWPALAREAASSSPPPLPDRRAGVLAGSLQDARLAFRFLRKDRSFAAIAIGTLSFAIGANTTIFTMADALALRGLPYPGASQLAAIETHWSNQKELEPWTSAPDFFDLRQNTGSFSRIAGISPVWNDVLSRNGSAERLDSLYVSAAFFPLLGVRAALGRTFSESEDNGTHPSNVVVLSDRFWHSHFGGRADVLGQSVELNGNPVTVIGVLPPDFRWIGEPLAGKAADIDIWAPLSDNAITSSSRPSLRSVRFLKVIGRLKTGVSIERASAEVRGLGQTLATQYPGTNRSVTIDAVPLAAKVTGPLHGTMLLLLGAMGFVMVLACANIANLLLTRAAERRKDFAVRVALGAPASRLLQQIAVDAFVLSALGGAVGIGLAWGGVKWIAAALPETLTRCYPLQLDWRAAAFTLAAVALCAMASAVPPAWTLLHERLENALRQGSRTLAGGAHALRSVLIVVEVSTALVLLTGAGLLVRSFQHLLEVNPGFEPNHLITISTQTPPSAKTPAERQAIYQLIREGLLSTPGVTSAGTVSRLPFMGSNLGTAVTIEGKSLPGELGRDVEYRVADPGYFETMRVPVKQGRLFTDHDDSSAPQVALINEAMARIFWPTETAIGKRIKLGPNTETQAWITIVGITGDVKHFGLEANARPEVYRPYATSPLYAPILVVRTAADPEGLLNTLAASIRSANAAVPAYDMFVMNSLVERSTAQRRFLMWLLTGFAVTAMLLAAAGVYGIVSQAVAQRMPEIGVRMALGSTRGAVLALIFREGLRLAALGLFAGGLAAAGLTQLMRGLLFEVRPLDPAAFAGAAALLIGIAALACYVPARRASRVDPLCALRQEG